MKIDVIDILGKKKGEKEIVLPLISVGDAKEHLFYLVNNYQRAHLRAGTASNKTKAEVSGGGRKPYKQKGTGNARRGSTRTPLRPGGGVVFGPKPRSFKQNLNKGIIKKAFQHAFSDKLNQIFILEGSKDLDVKTSVFVSLFTSLCNDFRSVSLVSLPENYTVSLSCRNIKNCQIFTPSFILLESLLNGECVLITEEAFIKVQELYIR